MSELKPHDTQKKTYTINLIEEMDNLWAYAHKLEAKIAELEAESDQLTAHSDIERQDDKSPNDTQTQTFVYGKERDE